MRMYRILFPVFAMAVLSFAQSNPTGTIGPGFNVATIDKSLDPCVDFYQYACGNWLKIAEIPDDQPRWGSFVDLRERNTSILRDILEKAAVDKPSRNPLDQKIGDYYGACIDETAADQKGLEPLKPELDRIRAVQDKMSLIDAVARVHLVAPHLLFQTGPTGHPLFTFDARPDLHNAEMVAANIDQGGLSLPDRDYYVNDDPDKVKTRKQFVEYVTQMFVLAGQWPEQASDSAQAVLRIETELAKASMDRTSRRDPKNRDHAMTREAAIKLAPNFHLNRYFNDVGAPSFANLNVVNPTFFQQVNGLIGSESLEALKTYVSWQLLDATAPWLSQPFVQANFKMRQVLTGQKEVQARWKRCVSFTDDALGEALGQRYVELTFGEASKQRILKMVHLIEESLDEDIKDLPWMSAETKKQAKQKLQAIRNKIGYPDVWRDYSLLKVVRNDLIGNYLRANEFESKRDIAKIGKPRDRNEWSMTPPTVNAYYSPTYEEMKMINETKKIMGDDSLEVTATCVRIPVVYGHSESVYVELKDDFDVEEVKQLLASAPGIVLVDNPAKQQYPLASDAAGKLETFVGRIRRDLSNPRALNLWIVSDNLLKGAAWNAVQIAEYIAIEQQ